MGRRTRRLVAPFIVFEGIDGTGKSTVMGRVAKHLQEAGHGVWETAEETDTWHGAAVRRAREESLDPIATTLLFVADRAAHVAEISARRAAGDVVLCDRFVHSTLAYQSVTLEGALPDVPAWLASLHDGWCPEPDHVVLLLGDPQLCVERAARRGTTDPYEKADFLTKVQRAYQAMATADPEHFTVLDTEQGLDQVSDAAVEAVAQLVSPAS